MIRNLVPLAPLLLLAAPAAAQDWVIPAGTTVVYDTDASGPLLLGRLEIQDAATLRVVGSRPFGLTCTELVVDGTLDLSGEDSIGVVTLNTANQPEPGAPGHAGGGAGGVGSSLTTASTPAGLAGLDFHGLPLGGGGGETSYALGSKENRRGAGGGGGRLAADQPVVLDPLDPANLGLVATAGFDGAPNGLGAVSQSAPAAGGDAGPSVFVDGNPRNDFWGRQRVGAGVVVGEVGRPVAGTGGGAGGDAVQSATFPLSPFTPAGDEKGAGGGGGGGLGLVLARRIAIGPRGRIAANGGDGGGGENTAFFDRVGGGSGGGSGGWLVLEALEFDLASAGPDAITALGGRGGPGRNDVHDVVGAGGNGGPGVIQVHTPEGTRDGVLLPPGRTLAELTSPDAELLLPVLRR